MNKKITRSQFLALPSWEQTRIYFEDAEVKSKRGNGIRLRAQIDWFNAPGAALSKFSDSLPLR